MPVTPSDVAVELGRTAPLDTATRDQWQNWIDRAGRLITRRATKLGVDPAELDPETVDDVVLLAVVAHARNPEGVESYDLSIDDAREMRRFTRASGEVTITDEWWGWLFPAASEAFSTRTAGEPDDLAHRYPLPEVSTWRSVT